MPFDQTNGQGGGYPCVSESKNSILTRPLGRVPAKSFSMQTLPFAEDTVLIECPKLLSVASPP